MLLREEVAIRRLIRQILRETIVTSNRGWEGYEQGNDADNHALDTGYKAAYHVQYANVVDNEDHLAELETGGTNIIDRKKKSRKK